MSIGGDWGTIAIGLRLGKGIDPEFFRSFLHLREFGFRDGDAIIDPVATCPHHVAANTLMVRFLATNKQTLCLIDDDMVFTPDMLSIMRDEPQGVEFDILQAACVSRRPPHFAVAWPGREAQQVSFPVSGVLPMARAGFGFTFIRRTVLDVLRAERPGKPFCCFPEDNRGEDVYFTENAVAQGFKVGLCVQACVGHRFPMTGYADFAKDRIVFRSGTDALVAERETV